MNRSTKTRYIIFQILIEVFKKNTKFETVFNKKISGFNFNQSEISFINNVCLNSMRKNMHCKIILNKFIKSKLKTNEFVLLSSAIVQIIYLNIKPYAVVNETVNVSKKIKVFPGFINAVLKSIISEIQHVKKMKPKLNDFPKWFVNEINKTKNLDSNSFIDTFDKQPSLHIVFKSEKTLNNFKEPHTKSSARSGFIEIQKKVSNIDGFKNGDWWVQDFSSMIPIAMSAQMKNNDILDMCAAPGGKSFQIISNNRLVLNDINKKRILRLKENLSRLNFDAEIKNANALNLNEKKKYDIVLVDSPCSSIGTIRRHPEIFFRSNEPNLKNLNNLQSSLLQKSATLVKNKGKIIYMVCSFFHSETLSIVNRFLDANKNFIIQKYVPNKELPISENLISKEGYFVTPPSEYKKHYIDGFFSVQLIRND